jgi:CheY-like chemotaxis protein
VLVVEDDASVRALTVKSLRQAGFQVLEAPDGRAALDVSACHPGAIDLLLTDLVMPGLNGREVAERLQLSRRDLKVLFMSGYPADVLDRGNAHADTSAFLAKPFSITALVREVRSIVGS